MTFFYSLLMPYFPFLPTQFCPGPEWGSESTRPLTQPQHSPGFLHYLLAESVWSTVCDDLQGLWCHCGRLCKLMIILFVLCLYHSLLCAWWKLYRAVRSLCTYFDSRILRYVWLYVCRRKKKRKKEWARWTWSHNNYNNSSNKRITTVTVMIQLTSTVCSLTSPVALSAM